MPKSIWTARIPLLSVVIGLLLFPSSAWSAPSSQRRTPVVEAVARIMPSVVSIGTKKKHYVRLQSPYRSYYDDYFSRHHYRLVAEYQPLGTGVVVDPSGLILTNYHVVEGQQSLLVRLSDDQQYPAQMLAHDHVNDLCLLELDRPEGARPLVPVTFALPDDLLLGETVVAVGNPFGYEHSITQGVLSAKNRPYGSSGVDFDDVLQTDAAINPGNSGGPLINLDGDLIGINVAIRQDAEGIGFAIPLSRLEKILAQWLVPSRLSNSLAGLVAETQVEGGRSYAVVAEIKRGSPAAQAGLKKGMVVESIDSKPVHSGVELGRALFRRKAGETVRLRLRGGKALSLKLRAMSPEELILQRLGLRVQPLTPPLRQAMGLGARVRALAISEVLAGSDLDSRRTEYGNVVRRGDLLVGVAGKETTDLETLGRLLQDTRGGMVAPLRIYAVDTINGAPNLARIQLSVILD